MVRDERLVKPFDHAGPARPLLPSDFSRQDERGKRRHECQRKNQRTAQREKHRQRHRPEELSFGPVQREDGEVDDGDDQLAEHRRLADFDRRVADDLSRERPFGRMRQAAHAVFDHDHRAVDDQAEVDRPQAHQAGGDARGRHQVGREHHGKRNRQSAREAPRGSSPA